MKQNVETFYKSLISRIKKMPTAIQQSTEIYSIREDIFRLPYRICSDADLQAFQYKIINRFSHVITICLSGIATSQIYVSTVISRAMHWSNILSTTLCTVQMLQCSGNNLGKFGMNIWVLVPIKWTRYFIWHSKWDVWWDHRYFELKKRRITVFCLLSSIFIDQKKKWKQSVFPWICTYFKKQNWCFENNLCFSEQIWKVCIKIARIVW